ncbi:MAG TPA: 3-dehydroquinate synthase [Flavobacterium sp.]|uniref:3-dehydroquinate synthase n=1 Tax=Flavobacterium sp. TaxID=239 RepID=UPI002C84865A|nr:3-dehydroquinate synthase [Flavobacterium sp.]HNP32297.1 3-dehydroquinate synthase [Flavobacterium sp.]
MEFIKANGYPIYFGEDEYQTLNKFIAENNYSNIFILTDTHTNDYCLPKFLPFIATEKAIEIIEIEPGESEKNINTCVEIWSILTELGGDRKSLLINVGGGVVTDIGGFVASTFKRGIDFIHIPTTLLAMVDASIGGKNGVDLGNLKNQIGVINVPKMIIIDTFYLKTLPENEFRSGVAEMMKHGLIHNYNYWTHFSKLGKRPQFDYLEQLIYRSIELKNEIVMQDPTENGIRKALNFGHTLGHAIESYFLENESKKTLLHGEAIAAGMILESYISWQKNLLSEEEYLQIKNSINAVFDPIAFEENDIQPILDLLIHDKKNEHGKIQFALLNGIGNIKINQEAENELIIKSFADYKS